jgi:hypothetical protein
MAKTLAINLPDDVHEALTERAHKEGISIETFLAREIGGEISDPIGSDELRKRLNRIGPVDLGNLTAADVIREGREERADQIIDAISRR